MLSQLAMSSIKFNSSSINKQDWFDKCAREVKRVFHKRVRTTRKNRQLAIRITRRAVEILEISCPPGEGDRRRNSTGKTRTKRQVLFRHNLADIVGYCQLPGPKTVIYVRRIEACLFELVAMVTSTVVGKSRIVDVLKRMAQCRRHDLPMVYNKENRFKNSSHDQNDSDSDEVDVIEELPPIALREHPVIDIEDDDDENV